MTATPPRPDPHIEDKLDDALDDSFPASDPPSLTRRPASPTETDQDEAKPDPDEILEIKREESDELDEALEESFPASDPPAQVQPKKG